MGGCRGPVHGGRGPSCLYSFFGCETLLLLMHFLVRTIASNFPILGAEWTTESDKVEDKYKT